MITTKKELDDVDLSILKLACEGMTAKEIGYEINLSSKTVSFRLTAMRKYYECKSTAQLLVKLTTLGVVGKIDLEDSEE